MVRIDAPMNIRRRFSAPPVEPSLGLYSVHIINKDMADLRSDDESLSITLFLRFCALGRASPDTYSLDPHLRNSMKVGNLTSIPWTLVKSARDD